MRDVRLAFRADGLSVKYRAALPATTARPAVMSVTASRVRAWLLVRSSSACRDGVAACASFRGRALVMPKQPTTPAGNREGARGSPTYPHRRARWLAGSYLRGLRIHGLALDRDARSAFQLHLEIELIVPGQGDRLSRVVEAGLVQHQVVFTRIDDQRRGRAARSRSLCRRAKMSASTSLVTMFRVAVLSAERGHSPCSRPGCARR